MTCWTMPLLSPLSCDIIVQQKKRRGEATHTSMQPRLGGHCCYFYSHEFEFTTFKHNFLLWGFSLISSVNHHEQRYTNMRFSGLAWWDLIVALHQDALDCWMQGNNLYPPGDPWYPSAEALFSLQLPNEQLSFF